MSPRFLILLIPIFLFNHFCVSQIGFGVEAGFQQSIPLVMRDSFSGKPAISGSLNVYIPSKYNFNYQLGIAYRELALSHKVNPTGLIWQTVGFNIMTEWLPTNSPKLSYVTGINTSYIFSFGKSFLSSTSNTGTGLLLLDTKQKVAPAMVAGINFKPRPFLNFKVSIIQPFLQATIYGRPSLPSSLSMGIEYRITTKDIQNWNKDTTLLPEDKFLNHLKNGTLYVMETGTETSKAIFRKTISENYNFSKFTFFDEKELVAKLDSFKQSADSLNLFITKSGTILYDLRSPSTQGIIIYNYKMQNPIPNQPFFVRNLAGDENFEDPIIVKKLIKTFNKRLYKMYSR